MKTKECEVMKIKGSFVIKSMIIFFALLEKYDFFSFKYSRKLHEFNNSVITLKTIIHILTLNCFLLPLSLKREEMKKYENFQNMQNEKYENCKSIIQY